MRKICASEFAKVFNGRTVVGSRCFDSENEFSEINYLFLETYCGAEFTGCGFTNSSVSSLIMGGLGYVSSILGHGAFSKVFISIIQTVVIDMIYMGTVFSKNNPVHRDGRSLPAYFNLAASIKSLAALIPMCVPAIFTELFVSVRANKRDLTSRKRNDAVRWILRLLHLLTQVAHGITSIVQRAAALLQLYQTTIFCDVNSQGTNCV